MSEHDDLLERLRQTLNEQGINSFHILEDLVPLDVQMDYFKYFDNLRKEKPTFDRDEEISVSLIMECVLSEFLKKDFNHKEIANETILRSRIKEILKDE